MQAITHRALKLVVPAFLMLHAALLLYSSRKNFVTIDEAAHIPSGLAHWRTGKFTAYRVNPPLPRMLAVLPLLAADVDSNRLEPAYIERPGERPEWALGAGFANDHPEHYFARVCWARLAGIGWSVLGGWLIYCWVGQLYGRSAGLLGIAVWCFEPTFLGHAQLVTPDAPAAVAALLAAYAFWWYCQSPSWGRAWLVGLALGLALMTKFTLLVLYPCFAILWALAWWRRPSAIRPATRLNQAGAMIVLSLLVIHLGYGFEGSFKPLRDFSFVSRLFAGEPPEGITAFTAGDSGNRFAESWLGRLPVLVPEDYLLGIDIQRRDFEEMGKTRPSYLMGEWRARGWWYYYLVGLGVKVPIGTLLLALWGAGLLWRSSADARFNALFVWLPAIAILGLVSSQTGFNHHVRYVLPVLPFVILGAASVGRFIGPASWKAGLVACTLALWGVVSSLSVYPHSLSYFNELAGGPAHGHEYLLDSNIDWGQDLLFLKKWLDDHPSTRPLGLAYFGLVDPRQAGIDYSLPPLDPRCIPAEQADVGWITGPLPGDYALSVNLLQGMTFPLWNGNGGKGDVPPFAFAYFRHFQPVARVGYSIYIYHISLEEANELRRQFGLTPLAASVHRDELEKLARRCGIAGAESPGVP